MKQLTILIIAILLGASSCKKHDCNDMHADYFIFGRAFGMCGGPNCAQIYKIQDGKMYADNMDYYMYTNVFSFSNTPLPTAKYSIGLPAMLHFPTYMHSQPDQTYGCPDCHDQGGFHFGWSENGVTHYWHVDTDVDQQPAAIRPYIQEVNNILNQLAN